ncbi:MAG: nicotinate-nucleotide--dimethylbenzimidazole phosphoribosyltransferase [Sphingobacteriia bacterium]|jgi:nicotinate-nucleotide--dimethylbenzimidazole phosphoribosyltransferase
MDNLQIQLQQKIDQKTKPVGALGQLESIALQIGLIQSSEKPAILSPAIIVFAGDHGIAKTGLVNPYPQSVTAQMVLNFLRGGAAINVFTRLNQIELWVVDAGVNIDFDTVIDSSINTTRFIRAKQKMGTENYLETNAMNEQEIVQAIEAGKKIANDIAAQGTNCIGFGEMGIGNSASAALIMSAITKLSMEECTGRGTGVNDEQLKTKIATLNKVFSKHELSHYGTQPYQLLSKVGGFEIAMMTGAYLQSFQHNMIIVVDGFIATAALLIAQLIEPFIVKNCLFAHTSGEQGHQKMLHYLGVQPILNLGMRLGEGTGSAIAMPIIQSAVAFLNEMASFEEAAISSKSVH